MTLSPEIQDGIKTYLWEVATHLWGVDAETRMDILRDVESHIHEALAERGDAPTSEDLQAVFAGMPPPASYAPGRETAPRTDGQWRLTWNEVPGALVDAGRRFIDWLRGFVWESVVGIILLLVGLPLLLRGYVLMRFGAEYSSMASSAGAPMLFSRGGETFVVIGIVLLSLGITLLVLACGIGGVGMQRIRNSNWRLHGFAGAYIAYIVPQALLLTFLVGKILLISLGVRSDGLMGAGVIVSTITLLIITGSLNYFLIKYRWIALHRGAPEPAAAEPQGALHSR